MAAGSFVVYDVWKDEMGKSGGNMSSVTFYADLVSSGYTPSAANDLSSTAIANVISGPTGYAQQTMQNTEWSSSVAGTFRFDADDITFSTESVMTPKYLVITRKSDGKAVAYCDLATASAGGTDCTQATITLPAGGIFNVSG